MRMTDSFRAPKRSPFLQVAKSAVATMAAWLLAGWLIQGPPPVFAAIAALLVVQPSVNQSLAKALERTIGVIAGVVIASGLGLWFGNATWVILLALTIALLVAWLLTMTPGTSNQVAISAILVLALGSATPGYALDRILETLIGAAIGIVINLAIVPPVAVAPARAAVDALADELAASLERLAEALENPRSRAQIDELLLTARLMKPMRDNADAAIDAASDSLTLNPRRTSHRSDLVATRAQLERISPVVTQTIGMTRAFADHYDPAVTAEPVVRAIAEQLHRAAHDVQLVDGEVSGAASDLLPALTAPLTVSPPTSDHWMLIGSLMEDLRRIHESLSEPIAR